MQARVDLTGSGNVMLAGNAHVTKLKNLGSGNIEGKDLKTNNTEASLTGSGNITVDVTNELIARLTGSGNFYFLSKPEFINGSLSGSGRILLIG
jgi:hypothetical protein